MQLSYLLISKNFTEQVFLNAQNVNSYINKLPNLKCMDMQL